MSHESWIILVFPNENKVVLTFHSLDMRVCNCKNLLFISEHQNISTFMRHISWCPCLNTRLPTAPGINTDRINAVYSSPLIYKYTNRTELKTKVRPTCFQLLHLEPTIKNQHVQFLRAPCIYWLCHHKNPHKWSCLCSNIHIHHV